LLIGIAHLGKCCLVCLCFKKALTQYSVELKLLLVNRFWEYSKFCQFVNLLTFAVVQLPRNQQISLLSALRNDWKFYRLFATIFLLPPIKKLGPDFVGGLQPKPDLTTEQVVKKNIYLNFQIPSQTGVVGLMLYSITDSLPSICKKLTVDKFYWSWIRGSGINTGL